MQATMTHSLGCYHIHCLTLWTIVELNFVKKTLSPPPVWCVWSSADDVHWCTWGWWSACINDKIASSAGWCWYVAFLRPVLRYSAVMVLLYRPVSLYELVSVVTYVVGLSEGKNFVQCCPSSDDFSSCRMTERLTRICQDTSILGAFSESSHNPFFGGRGIFILVLFLVPI